MFEEGRQYANRNGRYTVLSVSDRTMKVQYEDGTEADLNIGIQIRIWENILAEEEVRHRRSSRAAKRGGLLANNFFVRAVRANDIESLFVKGWKETATAADIVSKQIARSDRLIYFAIEEQKFFTVATITSEVNVAGGIVDKDDNGEPVINFSVDIDAQASDLEKAVSLSSVEFESQSDIVSLLNQPGNFVPITEDEFELLAELLTELTEEDDEDFGDTNEEEYED
jgi:hypothetical protein